MADSLSKLCRKFRSPGLTKRKSGSEQSDERGPSRTFGLPGPDGRGGASHGSHDVSDDHGYNGATNTAAKRHKGYTSRSPHTLREPTRVLGRHNGSANPDEDAADHDEDEGSIGYMPLSESQLTRHGGATPAASTAPAHRAEDSPLAGPSRSPGSARLSNPSLLVPFLSSDRGDKRYYTCLWRNPSTRKNKNWDGDGVVIVHDGGKRLTLMDAALQTRLGEDTRPTKTAFEPGDEIRIGLKEIEIEAETANKVPSTSRTRNPDEEQRERPEPLRMLRPAFRVPSQVQKHTEMRPLPAKMETVSVESFYATRTERSEGRVSGLLNPGHGADPHPLYDPDKADAIVMERPSQRHQHEFNQSNRPVVDVVVNPVIASKLRPHQIDGVRFLYERIMCMRPSEEEKNRKQYHPSAILADEMSMGKTLQTITVMEMLLKQSCYYHPTQKTISCALIVCPLSTVFNWKNEITKWAGPTIRIQCVEKSEDMKNASSARCHVIIIGYDRLVRCIREISAMQHKIGLLVCDEAHILKSSETKTTQAIQNLNIARRILLTGTPMQNNLSEFYTMFDIIAPNMLGPPGAFKSVFEDPITRSRQPGCPQKQREKGEELMLSLHVICSPFILRRTAEVLHQYLPLKHEQVVFCSPSELQLQLYRVITNSEGVSALLSGESMKHKLLLVGVLHKLCNSPELLTKSLTAKEGKEGWATKALLAQEGAQILPREVTNDFSLSGKLHVLRRMLKEIRKTGDKVVIASNYTKTLDLVEAFFKGRYKCLRLDGTTKDRKGVIHKFNTSDADRCFAFLLSSKAGGQGINLIGANRLILLDGSWNPATDDQTMARIHRDGQKKECWIYRLVLTGTLDEKIFMRQTSKRALSASIMGDEGGAKQGSTEAFTQEELRAIFTLHTDTPCLTHQLLQCPCGGKGVGGNGSKPALEASPPNAKDRRSASPPGFVSASQVAKDLSHTEIVDHRKGLAPLLEWAHHDCSVAGRATTLKDTVLLRVIGRQQKQQNDRSAESTSAAGSHPDDSFDITQTACGDVLHVFTKDSRTNEFNDDKDSAGAASGSNEVGTTTESSMTETAVEYDSMSPIQ